MQPTPTVQVAIPVEVAVAPLLSDPAMLELAGQVVSRMLRPVSVDRLFAIIDEIKTEAHRRGLTNAIVDDELAAYNAERRETEASTKA